MNQSTPPPTPTESGVPELPTWIKGQWKGCYDVLICGDRHVATIHCAASLAAELISEAIAYRMNEFDNLRAQLAAANERCKALEDEVRYWKGTTTTLTTEQQP